MSFEEEWGRHGQTAPTDGPPPQMRLNQLPADQGGSTAPGYGVLATAPPEKKKAANTIENVLQPGTTKAADAADEPTKNAVKAFGGWETAAGLTKAHAHWDDQVKRLMGRLDSEKTALRGASNLFTGNDQLTGRSFQPVQSQSKVDGI
ncbi:hypothetical protein AMK16_16170 [Streptomyces sp. CB00455]|uniref:hypothetical protein n=1 Tax=Streptomyces sp. CB00455 TaxID=1703927 RepID=UPI00093FC0D0|nr:hypothetical protein [Streptomyces sp. CB00455]OKK19609.1 hypothetical protein AMK16_16170 [Streptomyces sp. CB00455]